MSKPKVITIDADKFLDAAEKATKKLNVEKPVKLTTKF